MKPDKLNIFTRIAHRLRVNRKYKDYLFRYIFKDKQDLLELYNAVNGTAYTDPEELEITTMEDVVYLGIKNDVSFIIGYTLNLYEHQSTFNPNMPLRGLLYFSDILKAYIEKNGLNMYSSAQLKLPVPRYIVFYNGVDDFPDRMELLLSDSFEDKKESALECRTTMLNVNYGHNRELLDKCRRLGDYAYFVDRVRGNHKSGMSMEEAIDRAVDECIKKGILADVLTKNRGEVRNMLLTDFNQEEYERMMRRDLIAEGKAEGKAEAILQLLGLLGPVSDELRGYIMGVKDADILNQYLVAAAHAESVDEFEKKSKQ